MTAAAVLIASLAAGCGNQSNSNSNSNSSNSGAVQTGSESEADKVTGAAAVSQTGTADIDIEFTARDLEVGYEETEAVKISYDGDSAVVQGDGAAADGSTVTISREGTYVVSGQSENGQLMIDAGDSDKIHLVFQGLTLGCTSHTPVYIKNADKVFLTLEEGTDNLLKDGKNYQLSEEDQKVDGVIYSKADLTINGSGTLAVEASYKHGIVSKDDLVITGGTITVTAEGGGLYGKDCVKIKDGTFVLNTGSDGIQSDNAEDAGRGYIYIAAGNFDITTSKDAVQAETVLRVDDGQFKILSGGGAVAASEKITHAPAGGRGQGARGDMAPGDPAPGEPADNNPGVVPADQETTESQKGLKAGSAILLNGGSFEIDSSDDSIHSNGTVTIEGGICLLSTGDDGIHGDGAVTVNGGEITVTKCYEGIEGLSVTVNGGLVTVTADDDGINAANGESSGGQGRMEADDSCFILITGGTVLINASADGIDSNGSFNMEGGILYVSGSVSGGDSALDYDGTGTITGGTVIAAGGSGMAQGFGEASAQPSILHNFASVAEAGSLIRLMAADGTVLAEYAPEKQYQSVVISVPELELNQIYTLEAGEQKEEINLTSVATSNGGQGGGMRPGAGGGRAGGPPSDRTGGKRERETTEITGAPAETTE